MAPMIRRLLPVLVGPAVSVLLIRLLPPANRTEALVQVCIGLVVSAISLALAESARLGRQLDAAGRKAVALARLVDERGGHTAAARMLLEFGEATVPPEEFPRFYFKALWSIERSYHTTFVASATEAGYGYNEDALTIQRSKVDPGGADIRRLFVCRTGEDVASLQTLMMRQQRLGIKVRYILQDQIRSHQLLRTWHRKVGVLDFSIIDGALSIATEISPAKFKIRGARLTAQPSVCADRQGFFDLLWAEASEPAASADPSVAPAREIAARPHGSLGHTVRPS